MTATRRFSTLLSTLTAGIMLLTANPATAGLADRAETTTAGELASVPAKEARSTAATAALETDEEEIAEVAERPAAVKRAASVAKPGLSRRAEQPAQKEYRPRPHAPAAQVRTAAVTARHAAFGASCHRR